LLRPGDHQKRDRRVDGLLEGEQLPGFGVGTGCERRERANTARRNSAAISERAEMKVIGGIEPSPILVNG